MQLLGRTLLHSLPVKILRIFSLVFITENVAFSTSEIESLPSDGLSAKQLARRMSQCLDADRKISKQSLSDILIHHYSLHLYDTFPGTNVKWGCDL